MIAAVICCAFGVAWLFDKVTGWWLGWDHIALCGYGNAIGQLGGTIGVLCAAYGVVVWALSFFRSQQGVQLIIGGVLVASLPMVLPHYLGESCQAQVALVGQGRLLP